MLVCVRDNNDLPALHLPSSVLQFIFWVSLAEFINFFLVLLIKQRMVKPTGPTARYFIFRFVSTTPLSLLTDPTSLAIFCLTRQNTATTERRSNLRCVFQEEKRMV